jgi:hypothetical protein
MYVPASPSEPDALPADVRDLLAREAEGVAAGGPPDLPRGAGVGASDGRFGGFGRRDGLKGFGYVGADGADAADDPFAGLPRRPPGEPRAAPPPPPPLDRYDLETYKYRNQAAAEIGLFAKLFSTSGKLVEAGVTQKAKRYRVERTATGRDVEIGVGVRLVVATADLQIDTDLSIPNLAAAAQLGRADTKVGLYVTGYSGHLGDLMPAPDDLKVETYGTFLQAFKAIQARVFSEAGERFQSPAILGYVTA